MQKKRKKSDKDTASDLRWYKKNRAKVLAYLASWKEKNKERYLSGIKEWKSKNHDKVRITNQKSDMLRRAAKTNRLHKDHDFNIERMMILEAKRLQEETGIPHEIDHVIPLSRGGWHHHDNLQILDKPTNLSKHANPFWRKDGFKSFGEVCYTLWPDNLIMQYKKILREEEQCLS